MVNNGSWLIIYVCAYFTVPLQLCCIVYPHFNNVFYKPCDPPERVIENDMFYCNLVSFQNAEVDI